MPNETEDYNNAVRAALPSGMTFSGDRYRYNNHSFSPYKLAAWYYYYILRTGGGVPTFSPASLFAASEQGVWYDPSDLTTLFQDSAGTTPVTATGQTVALMLDKSKGLVLGPELVTNGTFDSGITGWTGNNVTLSISSGALLITTTSAIAPYAKQSFATQIGATYKLSAIKLSGTAGIGNVIRVGSSEGGSDSGTLNLITGSSVSMIFKATGTTTWLTPGWGFTAVGQELTIDNISVRELAGSHATQGTAASRPTYGIVPATGRRNLLLNTDTLATQNVTVTNLQHVLSFTGTGTVTLSGTSTAGPLVGTGAGNRVSLAFTPTAGTLTLTVSGSVTFAQLERV